MRQVTGCGKTYLGPASGKIVSRNERTNRVTVGLKCSLGIVVSRSDIAVEWTRREFGNIVGIPDIVATGFDIVIDRWCDIVAGVDIVAVRGKVRTSQSFDLSQQLISILKRRQVCDKLSKSRGQRCTRSRLEIETCTLRVLCDLARRVYTMYRIS